MAFDEPAQAPRRSSRISAQTKVEVPAAAEKMRKPSKAGTKRAAEEADSDEKNKKVRHSNLDPLLHSECIQGQSQRRRGCQA